MKLRTIQVSFVLIMAVPLMAVSGCGGSGPRIPDDIEKALDQADTFELLSLEPNSGSRKGSTDSSKEDFHGWTVLGKKAIEDAATRKKLVAALKKGVSEHDGKADKCFNPRHGIRLHHAGSTIDLVICFECYQVQAYTGNQRSNKEILVSRSPQPVFDAALGD
jgi:hypothetical protein